MLYYGSLRFSGRQIGLVRQRNRAFSQLLLLLLTTLSRLSSACKIEAGTVEVVVYSGHVEPIAAAAVVALLTVASVSGRSTDLQLPCRGLRDHLQHWE